MRPCFSASGVSAKPSNTDRITIKAFSSSTAPLKQTTTLDESGGTFTESNRKPADVFVFTGTGGDRLILKQGGVLGRDASDGPGRSRLSGRPSTSATTVTSTSA